MKIFFTSDNHFGHANVIKYCNRPFASVEEMNEAMVTAWNSVVGVHDVVYHLGDFSLGFESVANITYRLNGAKLLIPGNHDLCHSFHKRSRKPENMAKWIREYEHQGWFIQGEKKFDQLNTIPKYLMCHHPYPDGSTGADKYAKWRPVDEGTVLLCGHVHEKWATKRSPAGTLMINVGVDVHNFLPVSLEDILKIIEKENGKKA